MLQIFSNYTWIFIIICIIICIFRDFHRLKESSKMDLIFNMSGIMMGICLIDYFTLKSMRNTLGDIFGIISLLMFFTGIFGKKYEKISKIENEKLRIKEKKQLLWKIIYIIFVFVVGVIYLLLQ